MSPTRAATSLTLALLVAVSALASPPPDNSLPFPAAASLNADSDNAGSGAATKMPVTLRISGPETAIPPGSETSVRIQFELVEHSYVNHEMSRVTLVAAEGIEVGDAVFPEPEEKDVPSLGKVAKIHKGSFEVSVPIRVSLDAAAGERSLALSVRYQACNDSVCFIPRTEKSTVLLRVAELSGAMPVSIPAVATQAALFAEQANGGTPPNVIPPAGAVAVNPASKIQNAVAQTSEFARQLERGWFFAFLFAFLGGILASLTPCVYPMIPITVAVIGARGAQSRKRSFLLSLVFVLGIAVVYSLLGVSAAATGGVFGAILQNRAVVVGVAVIFALLALGMLGFYDMNVPGPIANRLNRMGGKGFGGAFVVGMVTGIVASPCVGPVLVGMLGWIASAASNPVYSKLTSLSLGFSLMFVFAMGLGMLFLLIGTFTGVLVGLPRSGGWMIRVKHILGITLFGVAWYFALPILPVWLPIVLLAPGLFWLATGELEHERSRRFAGAWMAAAASYILLLGAGAIWPGTVSTGWTSTSKIHGAEVSAVRWRESLPEALIEASANRKPVMIDFYADWCIACKELDLYTYTDADVGKALEGFVAVKLDGTDSEDPRFQEPYQKYGVLGLPTVLFLTPDGQVLSNLTLTGFEPPEDFLKRVAAVKAALLPGP